MLSYWTWSELLLIFKLTFSVVVGVPLLFKVLLLASLLTITSRSSNKLPIIPPVVSTQYAALSLSTSLVQLMFSHWFSYSWMLGTSFIDAYIAQYKSGSFAYSKGTSPAPLFYSEPEFINGPAFAFGVE